MSHHGNGQYEERHAPYGRGTPYDQSRDGHYYHNNRCGDRHSNWTRQCDGDCWDSDGRGHQDLDDLVMSLPLGGLVMMFSMVSSVDLGVGGPKGLMLWVEALLLQDPVLVDYQQPRGVLRGNRELAMAKLPHLGD